MCRRTGYKGPLKNGSRPAIPIGGNPLPPVSKGATPTAENWGEGQWQTVEFAVCEVKSNSMQALLVRVGIDATAGGWNGPVDPGTMKFTYVPIPEYSPKIRPNLHRRYEEIKPFLPAGSSLPPQLHGKTMHLDPDFSTLTYGDGGQRAIQIQRLTRGDLLVFYAGLGPQDASSDGLVYGLVGLYVIDEIVPAKDVPASRWGENAHTRRIVNPEDGDIVVRALKGASGRLESCIPVGEYRNRAYRVREDILADWGGLGVRDGYFQRSARLPRFLNAERFYSWFQKMKIPLIQKNN